MLTVQNLTSYYSNIKILKDLTFSLRKGKVTCLLGRNGAGKTTTLKSIMGLVDKTEGLISFNDETISEISPHHIPKKGIGYVPQGRRLFSELTVEENLEIGLLTRRKSKVTKNNVLTMFPKLKERLDQISGTLSGGEQQMLALARALCIEPTLLLLDEPTEGLSPQMTKRVADLLNEISSRGVSILLVEQKLSIAMKISHRVYVMGHGQIVFEGTPAELEKREDIRKEMRIQRIQRGRVNSTIDITEKEFDAFLATDESLDALQPELLVRQILVKDKSTAENIINEINKNVEFSDLAKRYSVSATAQNGGLMSWKRLSEMPALYENALEKKSVGFISDPLESGSGFHILKLEDKQGDFVQFQDQWKSRHILLMPTAIRDDEETERLLNEIRDRIISGEDFGALADEYSEDGTDGEPGLKAKKAY